MKKSFLLFFALISFAFIAVSARSIVRDGYRRMPVHQQVTSTDGCLWHVDGWVDISGQFGWPPVHVNHYHITMSGACGTHEFNGRVSPGDITSEPKIDGTLIDGKTGEEEDIDQSTFLLSVLEQLKEQD